MNDAWKRIFNNYIECHKAIGTLVSHHVIDDEMEADLRFNLLDEIIETMKTEIEE